MKKIFYILSIVTILFSQTACDLLDTTPQDFFGSGNFWNNTAQVNGYMNGLHNDLRNSYQMFYVLGEARGGTQRTGVGSLGTSLDMEQVKLNLINKDNTGISNWYGLYSRIMQVNLFLDNVENRCEFLSDADRKYFLGQAYGLRALYYFMLYRTYGGVPIVKTVDLLTGQISADKFYVPRNTPKETLDFIKEDINKSEASFASNVTIKKTMWSKYATLMLKAEIYMWAAKVTTGNQAATGNADLTTAKDALQQVTGKFSLLPNFSEIYSKKSNDEIIFTLHFSDTEATNWASLFLYASADVSKLVDKNGNALGDVLNLRGNGGPLRHEWKPSFWYSYDEKDSRRDASFLQYFAGSDFGIVLKKCVGSINSTNNRVFDSDVIVYRYADVLLMMAEIENSLTGKSATYINQIRERAYGSNYSAAVAHVDGTFAENELAILKERDKEFVWEGKRWFDVVRMHDANKKSLVFSADANYPTTVGGTASPLLSSADAHKVLWPVDVNTLNINPLLEQTPGYDK